MKVYIYQLGHRDTILDKEQILWFFKTKIKKMTNSQKGRYLMTFRKKWFDQLIKEQSYELAEFLHKHISESAVQRSERLKKEAKEKSLKEYQAFTEQIKQKQVISNLINSICLN